MLTLPRDCGTEDLRKRLALTCLRKGRLNRRHLPYPSLPSLRYGFLCQVSKWLGGGGESGGGGGRDGYIEDDPMENDLKSFLEHFPVWETGY